jgi:hypothetical protein
MTERGDDNQFFQRTEERAAPSGIDYDYRYSSRGSAADGDEYLNEPPIPPK